MEKLKQLISVSLSQSTGIDEVMEDSRMSSFIDGKSMELRLGLSSDMKIEIINVGPIGSKVGNYDSVLTLKRKNKDKLHPKKIIQDISFSKSQPSGAGLLSAVGCLQSTMGSSAAIVLQSVLRRAGVKTESTGMGSLLQTWRSKSKDSLDLAEKRRSEYLAKEFAVGEKDYKFLRGSPDDTSTIDLNKVKSIIGDFGQSLTGALTNEKTLAPPEKELRIICNAFSCDAIDRCNQEVEQPDWWDSSSINERIKNWMAVLIELREELKNRVGRKTQEYKDPQLEGQITKLKTMSDIYEILKESKALAESNKAIREEISTFKTKLTENSSNILEIYKQLIESPLFEAMTGSLKATIRQLARSSQTFNTMHALMSASRVVSIRPELFAEERRFGHELAATALKAIDKELEATLKQIEEEDDSVGYWPQNDQHIGHVKDLIAVERKYALVEKFNSTFFEHAHDEIEAGCKKNLAKIKSKVKDSVAAWDEKAIKEVVELKGKRNESLLNLDIDAKILSTGFSQNLIIMIHMLESLRELGLGELINPKVYQYLKEKRPLLKEGIQLNAISEFYNSLSKMDSIMLQCHKPLLIDKIVALEDLIQNADYNIENKPHELHLFMKKATDIIQKFETENSSLKKAHFEIINDFASLINIDLITGNEEWKKLIKKAVSKIQTLTKNKPEKYVMVWTNTLSWQLLKVLSYQIKINLMNISNYIPQFETNVKLLNNKILLYPSIPQIRSTLYSQIDMLINFPTSLSFFENWSKMVESIPSECGKYLNYAYSQIDSILKLLETKMQGLHRWIAISCLDSSRISGNPRLNRGEIWKKIVETIKTNRRELERQEDFVDAGCIRLRISNFKIQIDERLTNLLDAMITQIDSTMKEDKEKVDVFLDSLTSTMNYQPQSTEELRQAWEAFDGVQVKMTDFLPSLRNLEDKVYLIKTLGRVTPASEETVNRWHELESRVRNFQNELKDKQEFMKTEIVSKIDNLKTDLEKFNSRWLTVKMDERETLTRKIATEYLIALQGIVGNWKDLKLQVERTKRDLAHFGMDDRGKLDIFDEMNTEIEKEIANWEIYKEFEESLRSIEEKKHVGNGKVAFELQDLLVDWIGRLKIKKTKEEIFVGKLIEEYQTIWPGLKLMIGESFQREHWNQMMHILGIKGINPDALTFGHILEKSSIILQKIDDLKELAARAQGEVTIREALQELDNWCATSEFELMEYTDTFKRKIPLIKEWTEMMSKVGDNQSLLQSIKDSKFFSRFKDRITQFDKRMGGLDRYLTKINNVQRRWLYLEPIFNKGALPSEKPRFQNLNDKFVEIMRTIEKNKKISLLGDINGLDTTLNEIIEQIEVCQSALNKFLEETRNRFPRFFFLGDDDLLEILGQSENPSIIKLHLKKIFAGIFDVEFKNKPDGGMTISSMLSSVGEVVPLKTPVPIVSNLENWLSALEKEMFVTLEESLTACIKDTQLSINQFPGQILGLTKEVDFSLKILDAIEKNKVPEVKKHLDGFLDSLTKSKNKLQKVDQMKVKSLIMDVIHQIEVADELIKNKVADPKNWYWFKQLKYFISKKTKKCMSMMCRATFDYTYEYQGNPAKLVHTPLTDKCYLTLTQGMMLGFGGNPYGPAGTGKTESVKALGQCMARMVLVFNCDENLDYKSMARIFVGLVKCGAWGCFDEFNRLIEEQLSAISQQIQIIQDAIREKKPHLHMMGKDIEVNFNAGIFVTLNPAGKGYGGRSKLPDNLKLLFRPVAMSRPDNELIGEVLLFSEGFKDAKRLSKKIVNIFTLCNQLLSKQQHYDWGLRALKVILTTSGELMQITREKGDKAVLSSAKLEDEILLKALNDNTASKLTSEDLAKFNDLIQDVLPDVAVPDIKQEDLIKAIQNTLTKHNYEIQERQLNKIIQFHSALNQRIGVVIMGPSGSGKTTIWSVLKDALASMGITVKVYIMNPKAISRNQLLGYMDPNTREFHNGVLTSAARKVIKEPTQVLNWIICDGDVDPKWIEALNSVLDDNHLLTLPTGERIAFGSNVNFIFETHDLKFASPATVSRMGMIYLNNEDVNIHSLVAKWKKEKQVNEDSKLNGYLKDYFEDIVKLVAMYEESQVIKTTRMGSILSLLAQVKDCEQKKNFAVGAMRGLLSNFPPELRDEIMNKLSSILGEKLSFINYFDDKQGTVVPYKTIQSSDQKMSLEKSKEICVLTPFVQANLAIIKKVLDSNGTAIIVGPDGGGKNTIIKKAISNLSSQMKINTVVLFCNSQTSSSQIINQLVESCVKSTTSTGPILRPKDCTRLIFYLRDINLAKPDEYNSIELISFLQQLHSHRGFYDDELEFTQLDKNVQFIVSMNPSSDIGRNEISTRLTACTNILYIDYPTKEDMKVIVKELVEETFIKSASIAALVKSKPSYVDQVTGFMLELFSFVKSNFTPETQKHYNFTPKDIGSILENSLTYEVETVDELSFCILTEASITFRSRLVKSEEISKYDSNVRKFSQSLPLNGIKDTVFTALVKKDQILSKIPTSGYLELLTRSLVGYQRENSESDICFVDQTVELVQIVDKIISRPGGKAILIGSSGSGRKMLTHFACFMLNIDMETFSPSKSYTIKEFRKEIRRMLELVGFQGKKICMYLENHHILDPRFMEDINSLLSSNQIQGLFRIEEVESALKDQVDELRNEFFGQSVYDCFLLRIKKNFRAVFSLDPNESMFEKYLTDNPALLKKCRPIWVQPLSSDSLRKIAHSKLEEFFREKMGTELHSELIEGLVEIHRELGSCPRTMFAAVDLSRRLMENRMLKLKSKTGHLESGVKTINSTNAFVDKLLAETADLKKVLKVKQDEAERFLQKIQQTYESASDQKREAEEIKEYLKREEEKTMDKRATIKEELDKVQPIVDAAMKSVGNIPKNYISELKSFANPPPAVDDVFQALSKLNQEGGYAWGTMKKALTSDSYFKQILNIDARSNPL
jgi:dynein heavy chain 2